MIQTPADRSTELTPYKTSDTPFAAYLHYSGHKVVGSKQDPNDYKREVLIFVYDEDVAECQNAWQLGKAVGDLKRYHRSLKIVNRYVKEQRDKRER